MQTLNTIMHIITVCCLSLAALLALLTCWRSKPILIKLVALEVLVNLFICGVAVWALQIHFPLLLDICIALSLIMFLSTVAYCQFLTQKENSHA